MSVSRSAVTDGKVWGFCGNVAVGYETTERGETFYLTPKQALGLARALEEHAMEVEAGRVPSLPNMRFAGELFGKEVDALEYEGAGS